MAKHVVVLFALSLSTLCFDIAGSIATAQEAKVTAPRVIDTQKLGLKKRSQINTIEQLQQLGVGLSWETKACQDEVQSVLACVSDLGSNWLEYVEACSATNSKYHQCNSLPASEGPVAVYDKAPVSRDLYCRQLKFTHDKCLDDLADAQEAYCQRKHLIPCFAKICGLALAHCPVSQ